MMWCTFQAAAAAAAVCKQNSVNDRFTDPAD